VPWDERLRWFRKLRQSVKEPRRKPRKP
jgi:hypothetical protein